MKIKVELKDLISIYAFGLGGLVLAALLIYSETLIVNTSDNSSYHMMTFCVKMLICGFIMWLSINNLVRSNVERNRLKKQLEKYGEENIITQIGNNVVAIYYNEKLKENTVYFTDNYIYDNLSSSPKVIAYEDIDQIYLMVVQKIGGNQTSIVVKSKDGWTDHICYYVKKDDSKGFLQICKEHQPDILIGNSKSNQVAHKQHVKDYKNK